VSEAVVLLDGGYVDYILSAFGRPAIDYQKFSDELCRRSGGYTRFRTYYYHCPPFRSSPPKPEEQAKYANWQRFYEALKRHDRFEVRLGKLEWRACPKCGEGRPRQKRVDSQLAIDLVRLAAKGRVAKAILVAGDSDHAPAVKMAKEDSILVAVWHLPGNPRTVAHTELLDLCDERNPITQDLITASLRQATHP
jgi:uncharacterized LabA/DUF88 family protein